jgi:hypothetical protein
MQGLQLVQKAVQEVSEDVVQVKEESKGVKRTLEALAGDVSEIREDTKRSHSSVTDNAFTGHRFLDSCPTASGLSSVLAVSRPVKPGDLQHLIDALQQPWGVAANEETMQVQL